MIKGRKISENLNIHSELMVQCTFKTSAIVKHKLISEAKQRQVTLSECISDIVTFYNSNEDIKEQFNSKFRKFIIQIANGDNSKIDKMIELWKQI